MSKWDDIKGRVKEAVGGLKGDDDLKREGKMDRAGAKVKDTVDDTVDTVKDKLDDD